MSRFARTADRIAARQDTRLAELEREVRAFVQPQGKERVLDVGTGVGALALALAPHVTEVVGLDAERELLARARERAPANATFVEGDAGALPFEDGSFDLAATLRTLHHLRRPELAVAELARVTRPRGRLLVIDQLAPLDPLEALAVDRFERARTADHERLLSDQDVRHLLEMNGLVVVRERRVVERRDVAGHLDLADCAGEARARALALAPHGAETFTAEVGWYLAGKA